jgi:hypothetical protein
MLAPDPAERRASAKISKKFPAESMPLKVPRQEWKTDKFSTTPEGVPLPFTRRALTGRFNRAWQGMLCVKAFGVLAKPLDMDAEFVAVHGVRLQIDGVLASQPIVFFRQKPMLIRDSGPCLTQFRAHRRILAAKGHIRDRRAAFLP